MRFKEIEAWFASFGRVMFGAYIGALLAGCASTADLENPSAQLYSPGREPARSLDARQQATTWAGATGGCSIFGSAGSLKDSPRAVRSQGHAPTLRLSRGDVVNVLVSDGDEFNGDYTIGADGRLSLPYMKRIPAAGTSELELARRIETALVRNRLFADGVARVAVRVVRYAAIQVRVSGAVFQPGVHTINEPRGQKNEAEIITLKSTVRKFGDFTIRRRLTAALRVASGVRPDADISRVRLIRRGTVRVIDLRGVVTGSPVDNPTLEDGDEVQVQPRGCFQAELARPSLITPRGIRIYVSKIHFGADSRYDEKIPYGLRLLNAAIMASCIGGRRPTRGHREIVLVSKNPATGATEVVQRSVEQLLRAKDRDNINPFLMPDDGVACYDSPAAEAEGIAGIINTLLSPATAYKALRKAGSE